MKILRGNPGKRRLPTDEPAPTLVASADPPADLPAGALPIWRAIAPEAIRIGTLTVIDVGELAMGCRLRAIGLDLLGAWELGDGKPGDARVALAALQQSSKIFSRFGVGASDRVKIHTAPPPKPKTKWSGLLGGKPA